MTNSRGRLGPLIFGVAILVISVSVSATAATLITGRQIKDESVTGKDIKNGSLGLKDLSAAARTQLIQGDVGSACTVPGSGPGSGPGTIEMTIATDGAITLACHSVSSDADADDDGFTVADGDCDDGDASVFPGAEEMFDGKDDDCDGNLLTGVSFYTGPGGTQDVGICHAGSKDETLDGPDFFVVTAEEQTPVAEIAANALDDDCDGQVDEG